MTGMGSAPPPGGPGCGNAPTPPAPSPFQVRANALFEQQPGRVVVKILVGGQAIPFSGATDAGGYFYIPFIPEGQPFTAIARDTLTGQSRTVQGVGPATGQSAQMFFEFGSDPGGGSVSGRVNSGGNPVAGVAVRVLLQAGNALSSIAEARTDTDGRYTLPKLPDGSYTLETRSLNHARSTRPITLSNSNPVAADFNLNALTPIQPAKVYVLSSGNAGGDAAVMEVLRLGGHLPTLGVPFANFDGSGVNLSQYDAVLPLNNYNWNSGLPHFNGISALIAYVNSGGGLVTCEWLVWNLVNRGYSAALYAMLPVTGGTFNVANATTYTRATTSATMDRDLPASFTFSLANLSGSESFFALRNTATAFYSSSNAGGKPGLAGWQYGQGRVVSLSTLLTETELSSFEYQQLFINAVSWATRRGN